MTYKNTDDEIKAKELSNRLSELSDVRDVIRAKISKLDQELYQICSEYQNAAQELSKVQTMRLPIENILDS